MNRKQTSELKENRRPDDQRRKTYICNVRIRIEYVARMAQFFNTKGEFMETPSKLVSVALTNLGESLKKNFPVESTEDSIKILADLGYNEKNIYNKRSKRALFDEMQLEHYIDIKKEQMEADARRLTPIVNAQVPTPVQKPAEDLEGAPLVSELTPEAQAEMNKTANRLTPIYQQQAVEVAGGIPGTKESSEEPQTPLDFSKPKTRMTQEDIDVNNDKNAKQTADMRKNMNVGLAAGIVTTD